MCTVPPPPVVERRAVADLRVEVGRVEERRFVAAAARWRLVRSLLVVVMVYGMLNRDWIDVQFVVLLKQLINNYNQWYCMYNSDDGSAFYSLFL